MFTLTAHLDAYFNGRQRRGEIGKTQAHKQRRKMIGLEESFGRRPMQQFGPKAIDRWIETLEHLAPSSRRHYVSVARGFGRWLLSEGAIKSDPTAHVKPIHQPRKSPVTLTDAEVARLILACPNKRSAAVVWLMVGCGLRCVEVSRLTVEDYDPRAREIHVIGKGLNERDLPVPTTAARAIDAYLDETGRTSGPLIRSQSMPSRGLIPSSIGRLVGNALKAADVKVRPLDGRSPHGLRRTAASDVMDRTGDVVLVQAMLGHQSVETTAAHYIRRKTVAELREAMEGRDYKETA